MTSKRLCGKCLRSGPVGPSSVRPVFGWLVVFGAERVGDDRAIGVSIRCDPGGEIVENNGPFDGNVESPVRVVRFEEEELQLVEMPRSDVGVDGQNTRVVRGSGPTNG